MKTFEQHLAENNNDPAAAAAAMAADAAAAARASGAPVSAEGVRAENARAREIARAAAKLLERLGIALPDSEGVSPERRGELIGDAFARAGEHIGQAQALSSARGEALTAAGFDLAAFDAADAAKRTELVSAFTAETVGVKEQMARQARDIALRDASAALSVDSKKLARVIGDVELSEGEIEVTLADGSKATSKTWGVKSSDGTFKPALTLAEEAGFTPAELAPRSAELPADQSSAGSWLNASGQAPASTAQGSGGALGFLKSKQ